MTEDDEAVEFAVTDTFDLHTFSPRDAKAAFEAYLDEAHRLGFEALRVIHGRGIGVQRDMVRRVLRTREFVLDFRDAPLEAGGWGATIITLAKPLPGSGVRVRTRIMNVWKTC